MESLGLQMGAYIFGLSVTYNLYKTGVFSRISGEATLIYGTRLFVMVFRVIDQGSPILPLEGHTSFA